MPGRLLHAVIFLLLVSELSAAEPMQRSIQFSSPPRQLVLLELFTSEGCSSCPPADRWFSTLQSDNRLWKDFVPVAFHVDYWDYIGWQDRFASAAFSNRQRQYAHEGGVGTVYTPGLLQNGREWRDWYRGQQPERPARSSGVLSVEVSGDQVAIAFRSEGEPNAALTAHIALLGMDLESQVSAGENKGRVLQHDFVVLGIAATALPAHGQRYAATLPLPPASQVAPRYAIAAWVAPSGHQAPIQAVGGYLHYPPGD